VSDLAGQAGLVLRNVRLTEDLRARLEDLQAAQKRLVAAQDAERRARAQHPRRGAAAARRALCQAPACAVARAARSGEGGKHADGAPDSDDGDPRGSPRPRSRDLPPLLADQASPPRWRRRRGSRRCGSSSRRGAWVATRRKWEAAVYFSVLEALQNVAKYANASHAEVRLAAK
jgi:hypothetical protein